MTNRHESGLSSMIRSYVDAKRLEKESPGINMGAIKKELSGRLKVEGLRVNGDTNSGESVTKSGTGD